MLCDVCLSIFDDFDPYDWISVDGDHQPDVLSVAEAAINGCYLCKDFFWQIKDTHRGENIEFESSSFSLYRPEESGQELLWKLHLSAISDCASYEQSYSLWPTSSCSTGISIENRKGVISFPESAKAAQQWIDICSRQHAQCLSHPLPASYPTRLLEIGEAQIRLILTGQETLSGPYAALSYCWGSPPFNFLRLTAANLADLQSGVPLSDLPLAFREAISFARLLGLQYLWIDCLCIIQTGPGSKEDWLYESVRMQDVYANCAICLALNRAASPHDSIISGSKPKIISPFKVNIPSTAGEDASLSKPKTYTVVPAGYHELALYYQPLGSRAWALQERLLPARVLAFGAGEVFWSCKQLPHACESLPEGLPDSMTAEYYQIPPVPIAMEPDDLFTTWLQIVEEYTSRDLTYPKSDKLVAFSAIAALMNSTTRDEYIEGHFWKTIPRSLSWSGSEYNHWGPGLRHTVRRQYSTSDERQGIFHKPPTWSWASVDGEVFFNESKFQFDDMSRIMDHDVSLAYAKRYIKSIGKRAFDDTTLPSVALELSVFAMEGKWKKDAGEKHHWSTGVTFCIDDSQGIREEVESVCAVPDELPRIPMGEIEAVFCPLILTKAHDRFAGYDGSEYVLGVFQIGSEMLMDGHTVFERIGSGFLKLKPGIQWKDTVENLGMQRKTIMLG